RRYLPVAHWVSPARTSVQTRSLSLTVALVLSFSPLFEREAAMARRRESSKSGIAEFIGTPPAGPHCRRQKRHESRDQARSANKRSFSGRGAGIFAKFLTDPNTGRPKRARQQHLPCGRPDFVAVECLCRAKRFKFETVTAPSGDLNSPVIEDF